MALNGVPALPLLPAKRNIADQDYEAKHLAAFLYFECSSSECVIGALVILNPGVADLACCMILFCCSSFQPCDIHFVLFDYFSSLPMFSSRRRLVTTRK